MKIPTRMLSNEFKRKTQIKKMLQRDRRGRWWSELTFDIKGKTRKDYEEGDDGNNGLNSSRKERLNEELQSDTAREGWKLSCALPWRQLCYKKNLHTHIQYRPGVQSTYKAICQAPSRLQREQVRERMREDAREKKREISRCHLCIGNPHCVFMEQYIWTEASCRSPSKKTALAIDLSGLYRNSA